ncbi:MAG TPA: hypothetical protein VGU43_00495 [Thermoplasmata archaeon]|nr:hypothetical protein [Thermoplasmata archaeon]
MVVAAPTGPEPPPPAHPELVARLDGAGGYDDVFSVVRAAVWRHIHRERTGLGLGLARLPPQLGGYWPVTGNLIVLNESLVDSVRGHLGSPREVNGFLFVLLTHEYLHALGYLEELPCRRMTAEVARSVLGPDHPASRLASGDLWQMLPFLRDAPFDGASHLRIVSGFDRAATATYIR